MNTRSNQHKMDCRGTDWEEGKVTDEDAPHDPATVATKTLSTAQKVGVVSLGLVLYYLLKTGGRIVSIFVFFIGLYIGSFFGTVWALIFGVVAVFVFWRVVRAWLLKKLKPENGA